MEKRWSKKGWWSLLLKALQREGGGGEEGGEGRRGGDKVEWRPKAGIHEVTCRMQLK